MRETWVFTVATLRQSTAALSALERPCPTATATSPTGRHGGGAPAASLAVMRKVCETVGFLLFVQGVTGLLHEWLDWFRFFSLVQRLPFVAAYPLFASIVLLVAGAAVMIASDAVKE